MLQYEGRRSGIGTKIYEYFGTHYSRRHGVSETLQPLSVVLGERDEK